MPRRGSPYGSRYLRERASLLGLPCALRLLCDGAPADSADHDPPLALHVHVAGSGCCHLRPACLRCQRKQGSRLVGARARTAPVAPPPPSRVW